MSTTDNFSQAVKDLLSSGENNEALSDAVPDKVTAYTAPVNGITKNPQSSRQLYQCICGLWKQRWYDTT